MRRRLIPLLLTLAVAPAILPATVVAAPTVTPPTVEFISETVVTSTGAKARVTWSAASETVSRYQLQWRVDRRAWRGVPLPSPTARSATVPLRL